VQKGRSPSLAGRLTQLAAWAVGLAALPVLTLLLLAPHSERAWRAWVHVAGSIMRPVRFPSVAAHRHRLCSLSEAWSQAVLTDKMLAERIVGAKFRVLRSEPGLLWIATSAGRFWIPEADAATLAEEIAEEQRGVYASDEHGLKPGDVVLDCGANVGVYTRNALAAGAKLVVAIELAPLPLECLRRNFASEIQAGRVIIYPKGVWNRDDTLELSLSPHLASTAASVAMDRGTKGPRVPLTTIDKLAAELKLERVDFIKMDIEGAEPQALEGASATVAKFHPRMAISLEHRPTDPDRIPALVKRLWPDYRMQCGACVNMDGSLQPVALVAW
jgi:FkbM family methyltransferase